MKKILAMVAMVSVLMVPFVQANNDYLGTKVGSPTVIDDSTSGGIAIGDGTTNGPAWVKANNACQIGVGSNTAAGTMKYRGQYVVMSSSTNPLSGQAISAAQLTAGTSATAINGASITNLTAGNIAAGGTFAAINANALLGVVRASLADAAKNLHVEFGKQASCYDGYTPTNTFGEVYTNAPFVFLSYSAACTNATQLYASTIASNQIIVTGGTNYHWVVLGYK